MNCTDYEYNFYKAVSNFPHENSLLAQEFYQMVYEEIPIEYRLKILIKIIYGEFRTSDILYWINKCLVDEVQELKHKRIQEHRQLLKDYINSDDTIILYRGINSSNYGTEGISWTLDKNIALVFALNGSSSQVITAIVHINDILAYNSNIDEAEVIVLPMNIKILVSDPVEHDPELFGKLEERSVLFDKELTDFVLEKENQNYEIFNNK